MKCRKNVKSLTTDEKTRYVNAFLALKSQDSVIHPGAQSRYDDFVETHLNAMMAAVGWPTRIRFSFPGTVNCSISSKNSCSRSTHPS